MKVKIKGMEYYSYWFVACKFNVFGPTTHILSSIMCNSGEYVIGEGEINIPTEEVKNLEYIEFDNKRYVIKEKRYDVQNNEWVFLTNDTKVVTEKTLESYKEAQKELAEIEKKERAEQEVEQEAEEKAEPSEPKKKWWRKFIE
jgi:hypothetical protein